MDEKQIRSYLDHRDYAKVKEELSHKNPVDIAELLRPLEDQETLLCFRMLPKDTAAEVFSHFTTDQQYAIINVITQQELTPIVDELFFDDMIDMLEEMPANIVTKVLQNTHEEERQLINQFLQYPPDSAGSLMTIEYVVLHPTMTVEEALDYIMEVGLDRETVYTCYITSQARQLEGIVSLRKLVISQKDQLIQDLMTTDFISVHTHDHQEEVADVFKRYGFLALPVVDNENRLTGIITVDDIIDVIDREATEDVQKMAAMAPSELPYLDTGVFQLARNRIGWLLILMISATFTGAIINRYESVLNSVLVLASFIPMLMDTGGNSGSQPSALVIRGLALGEIRLQDFWKVMWKEFRVSLICGIILATVNFARIMIFESVGILVALTVSLTLVFTVMMAKIFGGILPMIAQRLHIDPAIMAGPLITTVVDTFSLLIYFFIATKLLGI